MIRITFIESDFFLSVVKTWRGQESVVWMGSEVGLGVELLRVTLSYNTAKCQEKVSWELCKSEATFGKLCHSFQNSGSKHDRGGHVSHSGTRAPQYAQFQYPKFRHSLDGH